MSEKEQVQDEATPVVEPAKTEDIPIIAKYDLTSVHAKYLDRHMTQFLIEWIQARKVYPEEQIQEALLNILSKTSMVDHYQQQYMKYKNVSEVPDFIVKQKEELLQKISELEKHCAPILAEFSQPTEGWNKFVELSSQTGEDGKSLFNLSYLNENYNITKEQFESLYKLAKLNFEVGDYDQAGAFLAYYRKIGGLEHDNDANWGKYAAEILIKNWPDALEALVTLQDSIDNTGLEGGIYKTEGALLQARAWLMHWSLFVYFFYLDEEFVLVDNGLDKLVETWLPDMYKPSMSDREPAKQWKYLRVLQTICPHLLRYICAAVIIGSEESGKRVGGVESGHIRLKQRFKDLTRLVENERRYYQDPITEFVFKLMSECDFDGALQELEKCEVVIVSDFFLAEHKNRFVTQARKMIFENHCRIHSVMDISMVAKKLNTNTDEAERYIVKMIGGAHLDAKIDSEANQILLAGQGSTIYRTIREKTKLVRDKTDQLIERLQDRRHDHDRHASQQNKDGDHSHHPAQNNQRRRPDNHQRRAPYNQGGGNSHTHNNNTDWRYNKSKGN